MSTQLIIRPAELADAEVIARFNLALAWESEQKTLDETVLLRGVRAILNDPQKGFYLLAEHEGQILGQVLTTYEYSDWRDGWYWWIQSVYVAPSARKQGIFRKLYQHLEARACQTADVIGLRLYVENENTRAQSTYQRMGMTDEHYRVFGKYPLPGKSSVITHVEGVSQS
jgi:ribosomal protein S18 acetylase RimI-like enzyme